MRFINFAITAMLAFASKSSGNKVYEDNYTFLNNSKIYMSETFAIDLNKLETYEAGALFLTFLAYPEDTISEKEREDIHASLCAWALRIYNKEDPEWNAKPQLIKPIYLMRDDKKILKDLKTLLPTIHRLARKSCGFIPKLTHLKMAE